MAELGRTDRNGRPADRTAVLPRTIVPHQIGSLDRRRGQKTMDARLQRRVQRYGWDLAAIDYEQLWQAQLAEAQSALLALASLELGEQVLDIACGTGLVSFEAAQAVSPSGH